MERLASKASVLQAAEKIRIDQAKARGGLGCGRLPVGGECLPDLIPFPTQRVKRHGNIRSVLLAFENEFPVVAEAGDEADIA